MQFWLYLICIFLSSIPVFSQQDSTQKDPTVALENFDFKAIKHIKLDSVSRDYINAIEHSLYHRFDQAEGLMKKIALRSESPMSQAARHYLLNDLYFWRGKYTDYVRFAGQLNGKSDKYELAKSLATHPAMQVIFSEDSALIPVTIRKGSYIIATVQMNDRPVKLILDTGAQFSVISEKLANELKLTSVGTLGLLNSLNTVVKSTVSLSDSVKIGNAIIKNAPVICTSKSVFFKRLHVEGLLGWDVLRTVYYTTDFKAQTLLIRKPLIDNTAEKNLFGMGLPLMIVHTLSGDQLNMFFDSGSNSVDLTTNGVKKLKSYSVTKRPGLASGIGKTKIGLFRYVKNFTFQASHQQFNRKRTYLTPINDWFILNIKRDGILSNTPFKKGRLTVDYLNNHFSYSE